MHNGIVPFGDTKKGMETTQRSSMHSGIVPCLRFVYTPTFHGLRRPALGMLTAGHPITDRVEKLKSLVLTHTHTYARILDYEGCMADMRATKTDMRTSLHKGQGGWSRINVHTHKQTGALIDKNG